MSAISKLLFFFGGMLVGVGFYVMQADPTAASLLLLSAAVPLVFAFLSSVHEATNK